MSTTLATAKPVRSPGTELGVSIARARPLPDGDPLAVFGLRDPLHARGHRPAQRTRAPLVGSPARRSPTPAASSGVVQLQLLPVGRHREVVRDVAERFQGKEAASEAAWIQAIYAELGGEGFTSAQDCLAKLQAQRLVDANDWALIMADCRLARNHGVQALALHERHNVPAVHGPDEAPRWAHTLITHRIGELYSTVPGFAGHAQQVQQAISQFVGWFEERRFDEATYRKLKGEIVGALRSGKARAKGIPDWVYTFEGGSTETI